MKSIEIEKNCWNTKRHSVLSKEKTNAAKFIIVMKEIIGYLVDNEIKNTFNVFIISHKRELGQIGFT